MHEPTWYCFASCSDQDALQKPACPETWAVWDNAGNSSAPFYLLDQTTLVPATMEQHFWWCGWHERHIADSGRGACRISTIFLSINLEGLTEERPRVFETVVLWAGHALDQCQWRWPTYAEAVAGHGALVAAVERLQQGQRSVLEIVCDDVSLEATQEQEQEEDDE